MVETRKEKRKRNLEELLKIAKQEGVKVQVYSASHCRLFGKVAVDYWPTNSRAWVTGRYDVASEVMSPMDVVFCSMGMHGPGNAVDLMLDGISSAGGVKSQE